MITEGPEISVYKLLYGESMSFDCVATGVPKPWVEWYKDDELVQTSDQIKVDGNGTLQLIDAVVDLDGEYKCLAESLAGMDEVGMRVDVYCKIFYAFCHISKFCV